VSEQPLHVAVVGGGIAGLAAAHALSRRRPDLRLTLLEGSAGLGGKLRVSTLAGVDLDEGAEALLNRRPEAVDLARAVGLDNDLVHPATVAPSVWTRSAIRPLPPTVMGIPADLGALRRSGIMSRAGVTRAQLDRVLPASRLGRDLPVGRLVAARLGREVRDRLVEPLLGGVYAGHADALSLDAAVPQVAELLGRHRSLLVAAAQAKAESKAAGEQPVFAGIRGGVGRLPAAVAATLEASGAQVRCEAMVRALERRSQGWRLTWGPTRAEQVLEADAVVLAVPAPAAARLLQPSSDAAAQALNEIDYASVAVVALGFDRAAAGPQLQGSGFLVPPIDKRAIKAATYSSNKWAWLTEVAPDLVFVRISLGRHREERDLQRDDDDLAAVALADLRAATGVTSAPVDTRVTRWGGGLPQYAVGHRERVARIRAAVGELGDLAVCGAAYDGIGVAACVASAEQAATQVLGALAARETIEA